jgi:hypothetical protein
VRLADFAASAEPRCAFPLSAGLYQRFVSLNQGKEAAQAEKPTSSATYPNVAARVQSVSDAGIVMVTVATYRLTSGLFSVEDRGAQKLKGIDCPVQL